MEISDILNFLIDTENKLVVGPLFILALGRVLLEVFGMNFDQYPITGKLERKLTFFLRQIFP